MVVWYGAFMKLMPKHYVRYSKQYISKTFIIHKMEV